MAAGHCATSPLTVSVRDGRRADLVLTGDVRADVLRHLEKELDAPSLSGVDEWVVDMSQVSRIDLACAYALLQAATRRPKRTKLTVRGARHGVRRTLRAAGLDAAAEMEK